MNLSYKTTTELKVIQERLIFELSQRKHEKEVPVLRIVGYEQEDITEKNLGSVCIQQEIIEQMKQALEEKNRTFNIKLVMVPESDAR